MEGRAAQMERSAGVPPAAAQIAKRAHEIPRVLGFSNVLRLGQPRSEYSVQLRHRLTREIKIRAAHEVMAARAAQLALFVDQLMTALRTIPPMLAGNVFG